MTVKEAIVRWNVTQSTVYSYLKDELVLGAEKKKSNGSFLTMPFVLINQPSPPCLRKK